MTIQVRSLAAGGMRYTATAESHVLPLDMPRPKGDGPDPHDYFDSALGGCKALTLMVYAQHKQYPLQSVDVDVERDNSEERKGTYRLTARLTLHGDLTQEQRDDLLAVAERCPVHKLMTSVDVQIATVLA